MKKLNLQALRSLHDDTLFKLAALLVVMRGLLSFCDQIVQGFVFNGGVV